MKYKILRSDLMKHRELFSRLGIAGLIFLISACLEPYSPDLSNARVDILVVDGFLDSSDGSATVKLTKASTLNDNNPATAVQSATVSIEGDDGSSVTLEEDSAGVYAMAAIPVNASVKYRVHIQGADASEYASDFMEIKATPPIDSLTRKFSSEGTIVYVNAHDDTQNTKYYRWEYVETYEYTARVISDYKIVNKVPVPRAPDEYIYRCYRTSNSTRILANSTVQLQSDVVRDFPVISLPVSSRKLYIRYSALVKQRAISKDEYTFLDQLRKTTEGIGSLFDPQPSQVSGNVHTLTASPKAVGYFSAGNTTSQRIFIKYTDLPEYLKAQENAYCAVDTICVQPRAFQCSKNVEDLTGTETIGSGLYDQINLIGYTQTSLGCADCRLAGGVLQRPPFW